jgi:hypothetical protein
MARVALRCLTMAIPAHLERAAADAGVAGPVLEALTAAMRRQAFMAEAEARGACGLLLDLDGPD